MPPWLLMFIYCQSNKMKNKIFCRSTFRQCLVLAFTGLIFSACKTDKEGFLKTQNGLKYKFIHSGEGDKPVLGDIMIMSILYKTPSDSILFNSDVKSDSFAVKLVDPTFMGGVEEGFAMMSPGDSAHFKISADSLFEKTFHSQLPAYLKKGNEVVFQVRLKDIIRKSVNDSIQNVLDISLRQAEFQKIDTFLRNNNMDIMPTENGAYLLITKQGSSDFPRKGDTVTVSYKGMRLDRTVFDSSSNFSFVLGANKVIPGWEECMPLLNKGSEARMVLPSDLGYGAKPYGSLPGYSTLVFDVTVRDIAPGPRKPGENF